MPAIPARLPLEMGESGTVLLERGGELDHLDELLADAGAGTGTVAIVEGQAGIGKSALLARVRERARDAQFTVLGARGGILEREHAFGVADQLLGRARAARRSRQSPASSAERLFEALEEMYRELARRTDEHALLAWVDDAHWSDVESLRLCAYLAARIESLPALLVLAARPVPDGHERELLATIAAGASVLRPRPLTHDAVAGLVAAELDSRPDTEFVEACAHLSGGNPFLLGELLRTARAESISPSAASSDRVRALTPAGVTHAVLVRLARLPADAHALAGALAVLGDSGLLREAAALAELEPTAAASAVDALRSTEVLARSRALEFVHPLIRNAIYEDLPHSRRQDAHLRAARLLDADPHADPDRVAAHLLAVEPAGDPWAAERLIAAGTRALEGGGCDAAAAYLGRALREPPPVAERAELLVSLAYAEAAGGSGQAVAHLQGALDLIADNEERARVGRSLGRLFLLRGDFGLAGETARRALAELPDESGPLARQLLADYLAAAVFHPRLRAAPDAPGATLAAEVLAGRLPPEPQLCAQVAGAMAFMGASSSQVRDAALAATAGGIVEDETSQGLATAFAAGALSAVGEYELAEAALQGTLDQVGGRATALAAAQADQVMANIRWHQGRLADAVHHAQAALALHSAGWSFLLGLAAPTMAFSELERGELAAARAAVELAERELDDDRPELNLVFVARGRLAFVEGAFERALEDLQLAGRRTLEMFGREERPEILSWRPYAALAARAAQRGELAMELAEGGVARARADASPWSLGLALRVMGQVAAELAPLQEAVELLAPSPARLEYAEALVALGSHLRRTARPSDARASLREGLEIARACGALPLAERAHEELLASGARHRKMLRGGPDALTPAEQRVARMAAKGLTNRQIADTLVLSTRTIETHLAHVYTKLGVSSRASLADALPEGSGRED
ncbi:MAG: transcriptional regulator, LuxR family [Solirubrobacterales bacterium]|nr:transcriptional regulator, LuxR family [Solirubrobacterales bacterium]